MWHFATVEMRGVRVPGPCLSSPAAASLAAVRWKSFSPPVNSHSRPLGFDKGTRKHWDKFYTRHQNKFFKDRHYLEKDWGNYLGDNDDSGTSSSSGKVVLEVGCGAGNTIFPLVASYPNLFVYACDFSPHAIELVKSRVDYKHDQVHAFVCDVANEDLCDTVKPGSVDVVTLIFMLSAVCPEKMPIILQNIKKVVKPKGYILVRDYAVGDYAQGELHKRNKMISDDFYVRGDGTYAFYFSEEYLSSLFIQAGFNIVYLDMYSREIHNRSHNITMYRRWIRATFCQDDDNV